MQTKKAGLMVLLWVSIALLFNAGIYLFHIQAGNPELASQKALEFLGGYIIELSLSVDNLFLFLVIFASFGIEPKYQRRVLTYGIIGAIIMRLIFIFLGVQLINRFHWILPIFGLILILSGIKILTQGEENQDFKNSKIIQWLGKLIPITQDMHGEKFFVRIKNVLHATPLFAILILVEASDLLFAIDSIPAIFSITTDTFIIYTSNIFAICGLRSMYFLLEKVSKLFRFVKYGVGVILVFVGIKLSLEITDWVMNWLGKEELHLKIPIGASVAVIAAILAISILASIMIKPKQDQV